jgi:hypothetical protein
LLIVFHEENRLCQIKNEIKLKINWRNFKGYSRKGVLSGPLQLYYKGKEKLNFM